MYPLFKTSYHLDFGQIGLITFTLQLTASLLQPVVGIYTDPKHIILYTSNGEARQEFSIVLTARPTGGNPTPSDESTEVRWVPSSKVRDHRMDRSMRLRIEHYLEHRESPVIT